MNAKDKPTPRLPTRQGASVRLVSVEQKHMAFLYRLATDELIGHRWILTGQVPRREVFEQQLWNGILTQFVVCRLGTDDDIGVVLAYNADLNHGFAHVAASMVPEAVGSGVGIEAVDLFIAHLFRCFNLRKLYFEVPEYNLDQFRSLVGTLLHKEGVWKDHTYYDGSYWDRVILALYRADYEAIGASAFGRGRSRRASFYEPTADREPDGASDSSVLGAFCDH